MRPKKVTLSLDMHFERKTDGSWTVQAPWIDGFVTGQTFIDAYWRGLAARND